MDLRHLRYFVAVAEERNFTRASERPFIAQPPLSRQIQQLEEELGTPLFQRGTRPLKLTEAGRFFYGHARDMLARAQDVQAMTRRIGKIERKLSLGFVPSTLYGILPKIIRRFRSEYSHIELTLHEMATVEQNQALKEGRIDVGFGRVRIDDANVRRIVLREEVMMLAVPFEHPLGLAGKPVRLQQIVHEPLILFPRAPRPSFADQVLAAFRDRGLEPANMQEVRELQIALGLVAAGAGLSIVPKSVHGMQRTDVTYLPLDERGVTSPIVMAIRMLDDSQDLRNLLTLIYEIYDDEGIPYVRETL